MYLVAALFIILKEMRNILFFIALLALSVVGRDL
jgi:hypothetical protein